MARVHIGRDNWFLVIPAAILGIVSLYTVNRMYRAGDIRRSIEVVTTFEAAERPALGEYIATSDGDLECTASMRSRFYGVLDVRCAGARSGRAYTWRVHVGQRSFAPADEATRELMQRYAPGLFGTAADPEEVTQ